MHVLDCIQTRRSIRDYQNCCISEQDMNVLLDCATKAATGSAMQPWGFVVLNDKEEIAAWSEKIKQDLLANLNKYPHLKQYEAMLKNAGYSVFHHANTVLVIYGNTASRFFVEDGSMAAANIMLVGHEMGIGSCWIGFAQAMFNTKEFKQQYHVPENYEVVCPMSLGYKKAEAEPPKREKPLVFYG